MTFTPIETKQHLGGTQEVYRFDNGYGASVVCHLYSYGGKDGKFELAVIKFDGAGFDLCFSTPITDDAIGHLERDEVNELLQKIQALPAIWVDKSP